MYNEEYIRLAIELAKYSTGGPFGALVVGDHLGIVAVGSNQVVETHDPTAHAEIVAIRRACEELGTHNLAYCDLYTSCEPCPMCMSAIYWARMRHVYYATDRISAHNIGFSDQLIYSELRRQPMDRGIPAYDCGQYWMMKGDFLMKQWKENNGQMY